MAQSYALLLKRLNWDGVMQDLEHQIARQEIRAEQMAIHLQDLGRNTPDASRVRSELYAMLRELAELKAERERRKALLKL